MRRRFGRLVATQGAYLSDGWHARVSGPCTVYGVNNQLFHGHDRADAFLIAEPHPRIHREESNETTIVS
jgi:hypothetical protein